MPEVDLEFLGRQVALVLEGQRELKADMTAVKAALAETATRDLILRVPRSFEGRIEVAGLRTELLRETLEARIKATEARLDVLETGR